MIEKKWQRFWNKMTFVYSIYVFATDSQIMFLKLTVSSYSSHCVIFEITASGQMTVILIEMGTASGLED